MTEFHEAKELATSLVNVKTRKRSEPAHVTGERLIRLYEFYGSWNAVSEKLDISREIIREFTETTKKLPKEAKKLFEDNSMFNLDVAYRITKLNNAEDIICLAKNIVEKGLTSLDVRDIVAYKISNSHVSIDEAILRVLGSKKKVVTHHIVIMELEKNTLDRLKELKRSVDDTVLAMLEKEWKKESLLSFGMRGSDIIIKLSEEGYRELQKKANSSGVALKDFANYIIQNGLKKVNI